MYVGVSWRWSIEVLCVSHVSGGLCYISTCM